MHHVLIEFVKYLGISFVAAAALIFLAKIVLNALIRRNTMYYEGSAIKREEELYEKAGILDSAGAPEPGVETTSVQNAGDVIDVDNTVEADDGVELVADKEEAIEDRIEFAEEKAEAEAEEKEEAEYQYELVFADVQEDDKSGKEEE